MLATVAGYAAKSWWTEQTQSGPLPGRCTIGPGDASITISNGGVIRTTTAPTIEVNGRVTLDGGRLETAAVSVLTHRGLIQGSGVIDIAGFNILTSGANRGRVYTSPATISFLPALVATPVSSILTEASSKSWAASAI